jgi:proteic killer suppression protein
LKGNRQGQFAVDVVHPYRLIFEPANDPIPRKDDRGFDWTKITAIRVIAVENYHD